MLDRPHPPGSTGARLDLVGHEQDAVVVADLAQSGEEVVFGNDVAAFALDRLDHDRGDFVGRDEPLEDATLELVQPYVAEGHVVDAGEHGPETGVVLGLRRCE